MDARREWLDARGRLLEVRQRRALAAGGAADGAIEIAAARIVLAEERLAIEQAELDRCRSLIEAKVLPAEDLVEHEVAVLEARLAALDARHAHSALVREARQRAREIARLDRGIAHAKQRIEIAEAGLDHARELHAAGRVGTEAVDEAEKLVLDARLTLLEHRAERIRLGAGPRDELAEVRAERISIVAAQVEALRRRVSTVRALHEAGTVPLSEVDTLERELRDAELRLVDLRDELDEMRTR